MGSLGLGRDACRTAEPDPKLISCIPAEVAIKDFSTWIMVIVQCVRPGKLDCLGTDANPSWGGGAASWHARGKPAIPSSPITLGGSVPSALGLCVRARRGAHHLPSSLPRWRLPGTGGRASRRCRAAAALSCTGTSPQRPPGHRPQPSAHQRSVPVAATTLPRATAPTTRTTATPARTH